MTSLELLALTDFGVCLPVELVDCLLWGLLWEVRKD